MKRAPALTPPAESRARAAREPRRGEPLAHTLKALSDGAAIVPVNDATRIGTLKRALSAEDAYWHACSGTPFEEVVYWVNVR